MRGVNHEDHDTVVSAVSESAPVEKSISVYKGIHYVELFSQNLARIICDEVTNLRMGFKTVKPNRLSFIRVKDRTS